MLSITSAPITPGTQPQLVRSSTIITEPQPLSITASGGKMNANNTRKQDMLLFDFLLYKYNERDARMAHPSHVPLATCFSSGAKDERCRRWIQRDQGLNSIYTLLRNFDISYLLVCTKIMPNYIVFKSKRNFPIFLRKQV